MIRPQFYVVELTNRCQMRCASCSSWRSGRPHGDMPIDVVAEVGRQIRAQHSEGVRVAMHGFGEPLLRTDIWAAIDTLHAAGLRNLDFATNCEYLTAENCAEIVRRAGYLKMVTLSLNAATADSWVRMHYGGTEEMYERCVDGCKRFVAANRAAGGRVCARLQVLMCDTTAGQTADTIRSIFGPEAGAYQCHMKPANSYKGVVAMEDRIKHGLRDSRDCTYYAEYSLLIQWDGDIAGCCFDDTKRQICGNVRDGLMSPKVQERLAEYQHNAPVFCRECQELTR